MPKPSLPTGGAEKIQKKAAKAGFAWPDAAGAAGKLTEEARELQDAIAEGGNVREELGDALFAAVGVAYRLGIDPEDALQEACDKFIQRFSRMEAAASAQGQTLDQLSGDALLTLWNSVKTIQRMYNGPRAGNPNPTNEMHQKEESFT